MKKSVGVSILLLCGLSHAGLATTNTQTIQHQSPSISSGVPINRIVAIVNNDVITQSMLNQHIEMLKAQLANEHIQLPSEQIFAAQVLTQLIDEKIQLQLAAQNNIEISSKSVDDAIASIVQKRKITTAELYKENAKIGLSIKEFRQEIKNELTMQQLQQVALQGRITVTPQEIDDYLHQLNTNPQMQKQYHLYDILVALPASPTSAQIAAAKQHAEDLVNQLNHGADFKQLAVAKSSGLSALQGGDLGSRNLAELPDAFTSVVPQLHINQISEPIRTPNGFHILKLVDIQGMSSSTTLTSDQTKEQAANLIYQRKYMDALDAWTKQILAQAYVQIMPPYSGNNQA